MQNYHMASWDHFYSFRVLFVILELDTLVHIRLHVCENVEFLPELFL